MELFHACFFATKGMVLFVALREVVYNYCYHKKQHAELAKLFAKNRTFPNCFSR